MRPIDDYLSAIGYAVKLSHKCRFVKSEMQYSAIKNGGKFLHSEINMTNFVGRYFMTVYIFADFEKYHADIKTTLRGIFTNVHAKL